MNEPPQSNGTAGGAQQILITLDISGNLSVTAPQSKVLALGMLAAAQHILMGTKAEAVVVPVKRIIP